MTKILGLDCDTNAVNWMMQIFGNMEVDRVDTIK